MTLLYSLLLSSLAAGLLLTLAGCKDGRSVESAVTKPYLLDKCIVSDEKLGEMGDPVVFVYHGQQIKLCCSNCRKDFDKEPDKFMAKIH
ncbi:MAG: hypothetical protein EXS36_00070 [Pedosphaera sp.]|nr:hypothetical protein [Pedosphaera sp.]